MSTASSPDYGVGTVPKSGIYTNVSARKHMLLFKAGPGQYPLLQIAPGETFELDHDQAEKLEKTPAFRAREIVRGKAIMPPARGINIGRADVPTAIRIVSKENDKRALRLWLHTEARPAVMAAINERLGQLP